MRMPALRPVSILGLSAMISLVACGKDEKKDDAPEPSISNADSMDDLKLSGTLRVDLPDALAGKSATSLRLTASKRSHEACEIGNTVRDVTEDLDNVANFMCHLEVEKDKISFGKKYKIMSRGQEFGRIYVDNSNAANGQISIYMCQNGKLQEAIKLTDVTAKGASGTIATAGSEGTHTWKSSVSFSASEAGVTVDAKQSFSDSKSQGSFKRAAIMKLVQSGVSTASIASKGTWEGSTFQQRGYGKFNGTYGSTVFENKGSHNGQTFSWTHKSTFDDDGFTVSTSAFPTGFAAGGEVYVAKSDMPEYLADSFTPDAPSGWDCSVDETVELDPDSAEHNACEGEHGGQDDCWGSDFEEGSNAQ